MTTGQFHVAEVERIFHSGLGFTGDATVRAEVRVPPRGGFRITGKVESASIDAKGFPVEEIEATVVARPEALVARIEKARYAGGLVNGVYRIEDLAGEKRPQPMTLALEARGVSVERFFGDLKLPGTGLSGLADLGVALRWAEGGLERSNGGFTVEIEPGPATSIVRGRYGTPVGGGGALAVVDGRIGFQCDGLPVSGLDPRADRGHAHRAVDCRTSTSDCARGTSPRSTASSRTSPRPAAAFSTRWDSAAAGRCRAT